MRRPAVAGRFYPSSERDLIDTIEWCFSHPLASGMPSVSTGDRRIRGAMVPHAGYVCSGPVAARTFKRIVEDGRPDAYVIVGPDHHGVCPGSILCSDSYLTPLGECRTHEGICSKLSKLIPDSPRLHTYEHSVEVQVPFIQYIDPEARIVPIIMGDQSFSAVRSLSESIMEACRGYDVVVIASTDMSHYVPNSVARSQADMVLERVGDMDAEGVVSVVRRNRITMCGYGPTAVAMMCSDGCKADILGYADSYDTLGMDPDAVVGYASAVFEER